MANKIDKTAELKIAINQITEVSKGHWVSVKDHSISSICNKAGLDSNWTAATVKGLRETGFCMIEGERSGMRFKMPTDLTLDMNILITKIKRIHEEQSQKKTSSSDLKAPKIKEPKIGSAINTVREKRRTHFDIDQTAFILNEGKIFECEIIGVIKIEDENFIALPRYEHIVKFNGKTCENILNIELFETAEQLTNYLLQKVQKLDKKR